MIEQSFMPAKGAIIGCGFFGQIQLEAWRRMPEAEIAAACDLDLEKARKSAPAAYSSPEEMLDREKPDFVDIATRPESHLALVRLAAERKIPVICQKPLAPDWNEAVAVVETAESAGIRLMVHENWRWQPWFRIAHDLIEEGRIGQPLAYLLRTRAADGDGPEPYKRQPYFRTMPRLLIYETLVHHIDTARFLFGEIRSIYAAVRRNNACIVGEDQAILTPVHKSGLTGSIDGHRFAEPVPGSPVLGDALIEGSAGSIAVHGNGDVYVGDRLVWKNEVTTGYRGDSVLATQRHFLHCLRAGKPFESEGRAYLKTFAAVEACYRSAGTRRAVEVSEIYNENSNDLA
jgi:predicted dehydrogenase